MLGADLAPHAAIPRIGPGLPAHRNCGIGTLLGTSAPCRRMRKSKGTCSWGGGIRCWHSSRGLRLGGGRRGRGMSIVGSGRATRREEVPAAGVSGGEGVDGYAVDLEKEIDKMGPRALLKFLSLSEGTRLATGVQLGQLIVSFLFVGLYVWSTYQVPQVGSWRYDLDILLCFFFFMDYVLRLVVSDTPFRDALSASNILDLFSFLPSVLAALTSLPYGFLKIDLQWLRIFRAFRVLRLSVIALSLTNMQNLAISGVMAGTVRVRLAQLIASVVVVLFTTTSIIQLVEKLPWHIALYLTMTTLTTVGYGDIVAKTGVVAIPVKAAQLYKQLGARRAVIGKPFVMVSTKLAHPRAFADFFIEFFSDLSSSELPSNVRMLCMSKKPSFESRAFQAINERRLTLIEANALSTSDLEQYKVHRAEACFLLADRFSAHSQEEDLGIMFQVWALKSYTKSVPIYAQVRHTSSVPLISRFLDPQRDVIISIEQIRYRLAVLSCLCPGASVLLGNLLRVFRVDPVKAQRETLAGRRWLRKYVNGCQYQTFETEVGRAMVGASFTEVMAFVYERTGIVVMGLTTAEASVLLNPALRKIEWGEKLVVIAKSQAKADAAMKLHFVPPTSKEVTAVQEANESETSADLVAIHDLEADGRVVHAGPPDSESVDGEEELGTSAYSDEGTGGEAAARPLLSKVTAVLDVQRLRWGGDADHVGRAHSSNGVSKDVLEADMDEAHYLLSYGYGNALDPMREEVQEQENDAGEEDGEPKEEPKVKGSEVASKMEEELQAGVPDDLSDLHDHIILCGAPEGFVPFLQQFRRSCPKPAPILVLHPSRQAVAPVLEMEGVQHLKGSPGNLNSLLLAGAERAGSLVYLCESHKAPSAPKGEKDTSPVLADAEALLTCYSVGADLVHAVMELCYTSSIKFLHPGLLMKGSATRPEADGGMPSPPKEPRRSWQLRHQQNVAAMEEGLAEWQANPYYCSGRVLVPALLDTFACHSFFNRGLLIDLMTELAGDNEQPGGALLKQIPLPDGLEGKTYGELVHYMALKRRFVPLGLYRKKSENAAWTLPYVMVNPPQDEELEATDRVFILRERGGTWVVD
ncbi:unnamed protein product [Ostreobium quekettii]|uniref:Uncharacterized protein n=1 Tax=Ostreobium quekettii TaxID=121088 RepID=A0A8S1ISD0_9CHLO|nr:unnamed protein product [Ostreobium quekettii]